MQKIMKYFIKDFILSLTFWDANSRKKIEFKKSQLQHFQAYKKLSELIENYLDKNTLSLYVKFSTR